MDSCLNDRKEEGFVFVSFYFFWRREFLTEPEKRRASNLGGKRKCLIYLCIQITSFTKESAVSSAVLFKTPFSRLR